MPLISIASRRQPYIVPPVTTLVSIECIPFIAVFASDVSILLQPEAGC